MLAAAILLAAPFVAPGVRAADDAKPTPRALWVWRTTAIRDNEAAQRDFFGFLDAPHDNHGNAIRTLFFAGRVGAKVDDAAKDRLRQFLKAAHKQGIRVYYVAGDPTWATPKGQPFALRDLDDVLAFNKSGASDERYDGFQYDVEPYLLKGWPDPTIRQGLLDLLDKAHAAIDASGEKVALSLAIPRWYDKPGLDFFDRSVIDRVDEVAIMDYVRGADHFIADAAEELDYAAKKGKRVWLGVETKDLPKTPTVSFHDLGDAVMERMIGEAEPHLHGYSSFAGIAVHELDAYRALKP